VKDILDLLDRSKNKGYSLILQNQLQHLFIEKLLKMESMPDAIEGFKELLNQFEKGNHTQKMFEKNYDPLP
jgi:hypothetical protein